MKIYDATGFESNLTGSFSGSFIGGFSGDGANVTGVISASYAVTSSHSTTAISASYAANVPLTASYAITASHAVTALTASFALNADGGGFPFSGSSNNPAVITGSMFISGGLVDFTDASVISGSIFSGSFVGDGTGLTGITINEVTTFTDNFINSTTASIVHNLGTKNVFVNVYDNSDIIVSPASITATDINTVTVLFNTSSTGRVVVGKAGHIVSGSVQLIESTTVTDSFISASSKTVTHNFNTKNVFVQTFFNDDTLFYPQAITTLDENRVRLDFNEPTSGRVAIAKGGHVISGSYDLVETATVSDTFTNSQEVVVTHNFSTKDVLVNVYDDNDYIIIPDAIKNINEASIRVNFAAPRSGRVVVAKGGHRVTGTVATASHALTAATASFVLNAESASMVEFSDIANKPTLISSSIPPFPHTGSAIISGSLRVIGSVTADTYIVSSSITFTTQSFSSGSTIFGDSLDDTHLFTGSLKVTGSVSITGDLSASGTAYVTSSKVYNNNTSSGSLSFWQGSQTEYDAISSSADPNTFYIIRS